MRCRAHAGDSDRCEVDSNRLRRALRLLHARPDRWARQIIPGEKQSRGCFGEPSERCHGLGMAEIVLGKSTRVAPQMDRYWIAGNSEDTSDFGVNCLRYFFVTPFAK